MFSEGLFVRVVNSLPNNTIFDQFKVKDYGVDKVNVMEKLKIVFARAENMEGKRRKCWLPAFSPISLYVF